MKYISSGNYFESANKDKFLIKNGIPDFFIDDESIVTKTQKDFYEKILFPNYNGLEDFGTLIE
mgnify:FL=1